MKLERLEFIDFSRGLAILLIVIFHYALPHTSGIWSKFVQVGGVGVHMFFLLSGYGLWVSSAKVTAQEFYRKRFFKILLPYYFVLSLMLAANYLKPVYVDHDIYAAAGHFLLYKMFDERIVESYSPPFWFISTIVQFYLVFPALSRLNDFVGGQKFLVLCLVTSVIYWVVSSAWGLNHLRVVNSAFPQFLWEFAAGMFLAERYTKLKKGAFWDAPIIYAIIFAVFGMGLMAGMVYFGGALGRTFNDVPAAVGICSISVIVYRFALWLTPIKVFMLWLGRCSYELYLLHLFVLTWMNELFIKPIWGQPQLAASLIIVLPACMVAADAFRAFNARYVFRASKSHESKNATPAY